MKNKKFITNTKMVHDYMEYSSPMNQAFLIQGVTQLAKAVIKQKDELREKMKNGFFNPDAWIKCAEEWISALENQDKINNS